MKEHRRWLLLALLSSGCPWITDADHVERLADLDGDGDGFTAAEGDCDDGDGALHPGAEESLNGADDDCDGAVDRLSLGAAMKYTGAAGDRAGAALAAADLNGDGHRDLLLGAIMSSAPGAEVGAAYIAYGPMTPGTGSVDLSADAAVSRLLGSTSGETDSLFGFSVAAGDLTGDGNDDAVVGSMGSPDGNVRGFVYLFPGPLDSGTDRSSGDARLRLEYTDSHEGFGTSLAVLDVDGDDNLDLLVGASGANSDGHEGAVYLFYGPLDAKTLDPRAFRGRPAAKLFPGDYVGSALAVGAIEGGGREDFLIAAAHVGEFSEDAVFSGGVYACRGQNEWLVERENELWNTDYSVHFQGEEGSDYAGSALASGVDLDGDGFDEILVGAFNVEGDYGAAYVIRGAPFVGTSGLISGALDEVAEAVFVSTTTLDFAGGAVSLVDDLDGAGGGGILIGAPHADDDAGNEGAGYLFLGLPSGGYALGEADAIVRGEAGGDEAGYRALAPGDMDEDGRDDLLLSAIFEGTGGEEAGAAYLIFSGY